MNKKKALKLRRMARVMAVNMKTPQSVDTVYANLKKIYKKSPKDKR